MHNAHSNPPSKLAAFLRGPLEVLAPDRVGALSVFPVLGTPARVGLLVLADAIEAGAFARELDEPSVRDLLVVNPTQRLLLLLDGEEVLGAQQNRVFDGSMIVPARSESHVAVCCVEQHRWDGTRSGEWFASSSQVAHPGLRRDMTLSRVSRLDGRSSQANVWRTVETLMESSHTQSCTSALADVYEQRGDLLSTMCEGIPLHQGQIGALAFIGSRFVAFDLVADLDAFARTHPRFVRGYALEALASREPPRATEADARHILSVIERTGLRGVRPAGIARRHSLGSEDDLFTGSALTLDAELVHTSVFAA